MSPNVKSSFAALETIIVIIGSFFLRLATFIWWIDLSLGREATVFTTFGGSSFINVRRWFPPLEPDWLAHHRWIGICDYVGQCVVERKPIISWIKLLWVWQKQAIWSSFSIKRIIVIRSPAYLQYFHFESVASQTVLVFCHQRCVFYMNTNATAWSP